MIIRDLWKYYGDELVLQEVSAHVGPTDRIGLVGPNGAGKTTLLKILAGKESADQGSVSYSKDYTIGYLTQSLQPTKTTLLEYLKEPFAEQLSLIEDLRTVEKELGTSSPGLSLDRLLERYAKLQARFEHLGGYDYAVRVRSVAGGLGFREEDLDRDLDSFSGGERMRISLGRLLLSRPSLLVLDEPTNYLDIEGVQWLEGFLSTSARAFIVVSHDRYFLDKVATRIWELHNHRLHQYQGNYSQYLPQRALRRAQQEEAWQKQKAEEERLGAFIRKFGAGTRARQAKSREKKLEQLPKVEGVFEDPRLSFSFQPRRRSGNNIVFLENVGKTFPEKTVLQGITAKIKRGQRIALLGANGSGKSTLLKILAGKLDFSGRLRWGTGVETGYFSQEIRFAAQKTVLEELYEEQGQDFGVLRSVLARFLFSGDEVFKKTDVLSAGERNRLALVKLLLHRSNFLLLDEPTNHLDVFAREALEDALGDFGGTILFVSHDRYFIDKIANRVWLLEQGRLLEFEGNFSFYEQVKNRVETGDAPQQGLQKKRLQRKREKEPSLRELEQKRQLVEEEIVRLEERKLELESKLAKPQLYQDETKSVPIVQEYRDLETELRRKYEFWEDLVDRLQEGLM